jgi:Prokaryotic homologs of the JAB domain
MMTTEKQECATCGQEKKIHWYYAPGIGMCVECFNRFYPEGGKTMKRGNYHQQYQKYASGYATAKEGKWKTNPPEEECVTCSLASGFTIYLEYDPQVKIELLMEEYPHKEWIGYLIGELKDDKIFVTDMIIPPHEEAYAASATAEPFHQPDNCIGIIHSHNSMGAFHSGTDKEYVDSNYTISVTVASKDNLEFDAIAVRETPCGKRVRVKCEVVYVNPAPSFDEEKWLKEASENVEASSKKPTYLTNPYDDSYYNVCGKPMTKKEADDWAELEEYQRVWGAGYY